MEEGDWSPMERDGSHLGVRDRSGVAEEVPRRSEGGFGYRVRQARTRPNNTAIRDLLADDRYTGEVVKFLNAARVGIVRGCALNVCGFSLVIVVDVCLW